LARDRSDGGLQQLVLLDDGQRVDELARIATREHAERPESCGGGTLQQLERRLCGGRDEGRRAGAERGGDGALAARLDCQKRQGQPLTPPRGRRARRRAAPTLRAAP